ncbi:aminotransferase class I/II-fold pyridoxal phosphate-dependent enzyme, partial [Escherichia coli]|uniref:aminotransferase class I/II-fold pyridoxal phosphate-dependent enzyme n=1 Tax=Escherichia coli TaxID=562 RepID=UPI0022824047
MGLTGGSFSVGTPYVARWFPRNKQGLAMGVFGAGNSGSAITKFVAPALIAAAKSGMDSHGFGMASVRFICGTQDSHKQLEQKLAAFLGMEDAILYSSCFDANGGLFETLLGPEDAIISDA